MVGAVSGSAGAAALGAGSSSVVAGAATFLEGRTFLMMAFLRRKICKQCILVGMEWLVFGCDMKFECWG